jgi:hypothetical protein
MATALTVGCRTDVENELTIKRTKVDEWYDKHLKHLGDAGYAIRGSSIIGGGGYTLTDKVNIELQYGNYKASLKLRQAIEKFDESSSRLATMMLILTVVMAILAGIQLRIMIRNERKPKDQAPGTNLSKS